MIAHLFPPARLDATTVPAPCLIPHCNVLYTRRHNPQERHRSDRDSLLTILFYVGADHQAVWIECSVHLSLQTDVLTCNMGDVIGDSFMSGFNKLHYIQQLIIKNDLYIEAILADVMRCGVQGKRKDIGIRLRSYA